ncbi:Signal transduction histidine kinase [Promicromonospora umidemergens]|uniref:histidine kinase n=1 Tax=Promicromonospora umidemergens TaxID=629679 RepID=A0ABP8WGG5_9MICO|nr:histidine kinase [Promicromonospora umidemergens]MCP2284000.1 Signal transduction histidine kinase [Promicromonospora umidemergens]
MPRSNELRFGLTHQVPVWVGHVVAVVAVVGSCALPVREDLPARWRWELAAVALVAGVLLLARRRLPVTTVAATVGVVWLSVPLGLFNPGVVLAAAIATFSASRALTRRRAPWLVLAAAVLVAAAAALALGRGTLQFLLLVLLFGALGDLVRVHGEQFQAVTERAERAEATREALAQQRVAEDRLAIARDLHDAVAHQIAVINLHAGVAGSALRDRPDDAEHSLTVIRRASRTVLTQIGDLLATLRDPGSPGTGPTGLTQLDDILRQFRGHGLDVTVRRLGEPRELPAAVDVVALRVIQEALTNAHKHGVEHRAHIVLEYLPDRLRVTVTNPVPAPPAHTTRSAHAARPTGAGAGHGLVGARERVESVRGTLTHGRAGPSSFELDVDLPVPAPESHR